MTQSRIGLMLPFEDVSFLDSARELPDLLALLPQEFIGPSAFRPWSVIDDLIPDFAIHLHSTGLSIATPGGPDTVWLDELARLTSETSVDAVSDHLGFSAASHLWTGTPLVNPPFNYEALTTVARSVSAVTARLKRPFYLENNSYCIDWPTSTMSEADFWHAVVNHSGALMLLDLPNLVGRCRVTGEDPNVVLDDLPLSAVRQIHIAGGDWLDEYPSGRPARAHAHAVEELVWQLLERALARVVDADIVLERTVNFDGPEVEAELARLRDTITRATGVRRSTPTADPELRASRFTHEPGTLEADQEFILELCLDKNARLQFEEDPSGVVAHRVPIISSTLERLDHRQVAFQAALVQLYNVNELIRAFPEALSLGPVGLEAHASAWYQREACRLNRDTIAGQIDFGADALLHMDSLVSDDKTQLMTDAIEFRLNTLRCDAHLRELFHAGEPLFDEQGLNRSLYIASFRTDIVTLATDAPVELSGLSEVYAFFFPRFGGNQEVLQITPQEAQALRPSLSLEDLDAETQIEFRQVGILSAEVPI